MEGDRGRAKERIEEGNREREARKLDRNDRRG